MRQTQQGFDIVIKGGTIYDGTLAKPYVADIGIQKDKIAAIGDLSGKAAKTIDAGGLTVMPGIIDVHTHCDLTFQKLGLKRYLAHLMPSWKGNYNYLYQGVTTVVTGNCGYGYTDTEHWFGMIDSLKFGSNVYQLVPHGMIRQELFGNDQPRELNAQQLDAMKRRVAEEMGKGAIGMSTGLAYAPGFLAATAEIVELARVVRRYGGLYTTHIRDESGAATASGKIGVLESIKEAIEVGRQAEIPVEISHLKITAPINRTRAEQLLELIEDARNQGLDVTADQYPYAAGSTYLTHLLPDDFKTSTSVKEEYKTEGGRDQTRKAVKQVFEYLPPEKTLITTYQQKKSYEGKTVAEIAGMEGRSPAEAYAAMVCEAPAPMAVFFSQDMNIVRELMPREYIITASDGWTVPKGMTQPHPRIYGTFPRKLKKFVIEDKLMDLQLAIRSMTSLPAEKFNLKGRGKVAAGYAADIAVVDFDTITDHATYQKPHQYSEGIVHLLVNGKHSVENGRATGKRGGKAVRRA
jgi:N-acyl-D-aspartate/D-glutamate deacylase